MSSKFNFASRLFAASALAILSLRLLPRRSRAIGAGRDPGT